MRLSVVVGIFVGIPAVLELVTLSPYGGVIASGFGYSAPAALIAAILMTTAEERNRLFVRFFQITPIVVAAFGTVYAFVVARSLHRRHGTVVHGSFYEIAAQVIPVLLLALTVDVSRSRSLDSARLAGVILVAAAGEGVALTSSAFDDAGFLSFGLTCGAMLGLFGSLVMAVVAGDEPPPPTPTPPDPPT